MASGKLTREEIDAAIAAARARRPDGTRPGPERQTVRSAEPERIEPLFGDEADPDPEIPPYPDTIPTVDFEPDETLEREERRGRPVVRLALAALLLVAFAGIVWWAYRSGTSGEAEQPVPLVEAEPGAEKVRPESEGGLQVPNQDRLVYDQIDGGAPEPQVERLLPPPEDPLPPPDPAELQAGATGEAGSAPPVSDDADDPIAAQIERAETAMPEEEAAVEPLPLEAPAETATAPDEAAAADGLPIPPLPPARPAAAAPQAQTASAALAGYRVQLAAFKSADQARTAWSDLQRRHPDALGGLALQIVEADLGASGTFFRVQAGPLASREAAGRLCRLLEQRAQPCLVVEP